MAPHSSLLAQRIPWTEEPVGLQRMGYQELHITEHSCRRRQWHPTPVLLPGKSHGRRSLEGCSSWGRWGSDMTERLHFQFSLSCIGEGSGNPLHCSCLENPRDGGAWWAAVYGVTQSRTWLKRLSSQQSTHAHSSSFIFRWHSSFIWKLYVAQCKTEFGVQAHWLGYPASEESWAHDASQTTVILSPGLLCPQFPLRRSQVVILVITWSWDPGQSCLDQGWRSCHQWNVLALV